MGTPRWVPGRRAAPEAPPPAPKAPVAERRAGERFHVNLHVVLEARKGGLRARTVDISHSGALFMLADPMRPDLASLSSVAMFCERHFHQGLTVLFGGGVVRRRMRVVRTSLGRVGEAIYPLVACCFSRELSRSECELLGIRKKSETGGGLSIAVCADGDA